MMQASGIQAGLVRKGVCPGAHNTTVAFIVFRLAVKAEFLPAVAALLVVLPFPPFGSG